MHIFILFIAHDHVWALAPSHLVKMGKLSAETPEQPGSLPTTPLVEAGSSVSMHTTTSRRPTDHQQEYFDDDPTEFRDGDLPPLYSDHDQDVAVSDPLIPNGTPGLSIEPWRDDKKTGTVYYVDPRLAQDASFLKSQLDILATRPPRLFANIRGTHTETRRNNDKSEQETVVDFDVEIELTSLLYTDVRSQRSWSELATVGNFEKVRRGTILTKRAPGFGGSGLAESGVPDVNEWCHRYCASPAGLKSFSLERRISGWDFDHLRRKIEKLLRDTNYKGRLDVSFPVHNSKVEIYNGCRTNQWRLTKWIEVTCVLTLMVLFTWPWLFFRTKRWDTVYVSWPMARDGRYASMSEDHWYNMWARAIRKAALQRRQGQLDQGDVHRADMPDEAPGGFADAVRAGVDAMGYVDRSFGWGGDTNGSGIGGRFGLPRLGKNSRR